MKMENKDTFSKPSTFLINSSYQGFTDRQKTVFDQLNIVEQDAKHLQSNNEEFMDTESSMRTDKQKHTKLKQFQGKESIFKKPQAFPPRNFLKNRKVPDYQKNPHKWTKYLLDVPNEDMSEKANTAAAMSFLKELEARRNKDTDNSSDTGTQQKIIFKKVSHKNRDECKTSKFTFLNNKVVMPEYVVGQTSKKVLKKNQKNLGNTEASKEVKLNHLIENDEED